MAPFQAGNFRILPISPAPEAKEVAAKADILLLFLGETAVMSGEATSRAKPGLPGTQARLFEDALAFGKPVIVVLTCGRPLIEPALFERPARCS